MIAFRHLTIFILFFSSLIKKSYPDSSWDVMWAYDGILGPEYWELINPSWSLCNKGKRQSPIDIKPEQLLFDPSLESIQVIGNKINGTIENTGRGIVIQVNPSLDPNSRIVLHGGPLSYNYTLDHVVIHYGHDNEAGSEHTIDFVRFPSEVQLYHFNSQLYSNWSEAVRSPNGVAALSVLVQRTNFEHPNENVQMKKVANLLKVGKNSKGVISPITDFSIPALLPESTKFFMTYEGSLTQPPCSENVEWIILNKPIYATDHQLTYMKNHLEALGNNFRPLQAILNRCIRTNIDHVPGDSPDGGKTKSGKSCSITKVTSYKSVSRNFKP